MEPILLLTANCTIVIATGSVKIAGNQTTTRIEDLSKIQTSTQASPRWHDCENCHSFQGYLKRESYKLNNLFYVKMQAIKKLYLEKTLIFLSFLSRNVSGLFLTPHVLTLHILVVPIFNNIL